LFPGAPVLDEEARWVAASTVPGSDERRLTLTLPALNASRRVLFLASGSERAHVVAEAFGEVAHPTEHPCERVRPSGARREALVDLDAASMMPVPAES
jgi:6-phosphogluconolactonase